MVLVVQNLRFDPALEPVAVPGQVQDFRVLNHPVDHGRTNKCALLKARLLERINEACSYREATNWKNRFAEA